MSMYSDYRTTDEDSGVFFQEARICIPHDSVLWKLSPPELWQFLHSRRDKIGQNAAADEILWALDNVGDRVGIAIDAPNLDLYEQAATNPFLSDEVKDRCVVELAAYRDKQRRRSRRDETKPRPNGTRRHAVERDSGRCRYCGCEVGHDFHLDHVIPKTYGGHTTTENLVVACVGCNLKKGGRTPVEAGMKLLPVPKPSEEIAAV